MPQRTSHHLIAQSLRESNEVVRVRFKPPAWGSLARLYPATPLCLQEGQEAACVTLLCMRLRAFAMPQPSRLMGVVNGWRSAALKSPVCCHLDGRRCLLW